MISSRLSLLLLCFGICSAVDTLPVDDEDVSTLNQIYQCFTEVSKDEDPCYALQKQILCLQEFSYIHLVKELLEGLEATLTVNGCSVQIDNSVESYDSASNEVLDSEDHILTIIEEDTNAILEEDTNAVLDSEEELHHRERRMSKKLCQNYRHPHIDHACANWMWNNYHKINKNWKPCSSFSYKYNKPCGWYWAKCKRANRNHHCCISVHCYGNLG